jgi:7-keto-8-aminopelargonate synthetase-like enzyme
MVDEAHATGLFGVNRRGLAEELGVSEMIEIQMGTLGKALGASGGYICGSRALVDFLINRARSFIFSTAPVPAAAVAATAAISLLRQTEGASLCRTLWEHVDTFQKLNAAMYQPLSAILPFKIGDESRAMSVASDLRERGFFVPAIRYPTVARKAARLRVTLSASHSKEEIMALGNALTPLSQQLSGLRDA